MSKYIFKRIYLSGKVKFQIEVPNYANIYIYMYNRFKKLNWCRYMEFAKNVDLTNLNLETDKLDSGNQLDSSIKQFI